MSTEKKSIYGESFEKPIDHEAKKELLEELRSKKAQADRNTQLTRLLREERQKSQSLQSRVNRLEEENQRLRQAAARRVR